MIECFKAIILYSKRLKGTVSLLSLQVEIVGGAVLHSKKNGDGYVDTEAKMNKIAQGVEEALAAE